MSDLVNENCSFKSWETLKNKYHLDNKLYFQWMQLIHRIPLIWKQKINDSEKNVEKKYVVQDHHLIKNTWVIVLEKLTAREIYSMIAYTHTLHMLSSGNTPTFQKLFQQSFSKWKPRLEENLYITKSSHYILPKVVTFNVIFNTKYFITYYIWIRCSLPLVK